MSGFEERVDELRSRREAMRMGGGEQRIARHHEQGKMTARERVANLLDDDSFQEQNLFATHRCERFGMSGKTLPADGVVTGCGTVGGRLVHVASQDFTVQGGTAGETHADKIVDMMKASLKTGSPFVFFNDSGGARIQEGVDALAGYGRIFKYNVQLSGVVPQISLICGPCAGGSAYAPALTDFIIQTRQAQMFVTGPQVIKQVTGEDVTPDELGGADAQAGYSGVVHFIAEDDAEAVSIAKRLLDFLPANHLADPPEHPADTDLSLDDELAAVVPVNSKKGYDVLEVICRLVDHRDFLEVQKEFAPNIVVGFGRIIGKTVGIVANQPSQLAGVLDIDSSDKSARFVRFCNAFSIPIVTLVDVPGFMPGVQQEYGGIIRHGAKMLYAYSACTVPLVTVILRKAYGGAYLAMACKDLGADRVAAWPTAEIAVMGAEGAAEIVFRKDIAEADDPTAMRQERIDEYRDTFSTPYVAASRRLIDDVIEPAGTRRWVAMALQSLQTKHEVRPRKKHGVMPQ
jgi:methylmalonyl-CoA carboxyltransferase large subunit